MRMLRIELGSLARVVLEKKFLVSCKEAQEQSQNNELYSKTLSQNNNNDDDENSLMYYFLLCLIVISLKCPISTINTGSERLHWATDLETNFTMVKDSEDKRSVNDGCCSSVRNTHSTTALGLKIKKEVMAAIKRLALLKTSRLIRTLRVSCVWNSESCDDKRKFNSITALNMNKSNNPMKRQRFSLLRF